MIGKTLGNFEITAEIGKGGMGEVYRAKDQKLGRDVAIKVLPEEFAKDTDRVARFQREAKLLASLNHPNIAAIYGLEAVDGIHFLVMELIEGDTLASRIKTGAIPVEEALKLALQIAEALEVAHEKGVIHRDLKPANIKVTPDGKAKVLDFGLAKAYAGEQDQVSLSNSPTLSDMATQQGLILGTAAYMSPEQARGKPIDKRTDVWAFGCVLYEMLTGQAAFQGEDVTEILAAVVKSGVNIDLLPANIHFRVREVITRCLQKDQKKRYAGVGDVQYEIERVLADPGGVFVKPTAAVKPKKKLVIGIPWVAATVVLSLIIAGIAGWYLKPIELPQDISFDYYLPEGQGLTRQGETLTAISPDGTKIVYGANRQLYLRNLNDLNAIPIAGTDEDAASPFFSPNGQWIGYYSFVDKQWKKININGGSPIKLCDAPDPHDATWTTNNTILFGRRDGRSIMSVSENGGNAEAVIEAGEGEGVYGPRMLPGGEWVLFTLSTANTRPSSWEESQIAVQSLKTEDRKVLPLLGSDARYVPTGHIVYAQGDVLYAVAFDIDKMEVAGGQVSVVEGIQRGTLGITGTAHYGFSDTGTLVYFGAGVQGSVESQELVWVDSEGQEEPLSAEPNGYQFVRISPDGTQVALTISNEDVNDDIYIWDIADKTLRQLTYDKAEDSFPLWTPDSKKIVFSSHRNGSNGIYIKAVDGTGEVELLSDQGSPYSWADDGKILILVKDENIGMLPMEGDKSVKWLLQEEYRETLPQISPDGKWMAYLSYELGQSKIYICPFPDVKGGKWSIPTNRVASQRWSMDGRKILYWTRDALMSVTVETIPTFKLGKPEVILKRQANWSYSMGATLISWDIHPDDGRFLLIKPATIAAGLPTASLTPKIIVKTNWFEELKEKVLVD
jgi:Tol biopolymer transport system component